MASISCDKTSNYYDVRNLELEKLLYDKIDIDPSYIPANANFNGQIYIHNIDSRNKVTKYEKSICDGI